MRSNRSDDAKWLDGYIESLEAFREFNKDVTVNQVLTFLYVAREPGITQTDTLKLLGLATGGSSRIVSALARYGDRTGKKNGWDLLKLEENPEDRRYKLMTLTPSGVEFMNKVRESIRKSSYEIKQSSEDDSSHI